MSGALMAHAAQAGYLRCLPAMERVWDHGFRGEQDPDRREELMQEARALSWQYWLRTLEQGKDPAAFPTALASWVVKAVWGGQGLGRSRRFSCQGSGGEVNRREDRGRKGKAPARMRESLDDDSRAVGPHHDPARVVESRDTYRATLARLTPWARFVARLLAEGYGTGEVAGITGVSPGAISQIRQRVFLAYQVLTREEG